MKKYLAISFILFSFVLFGQDNYSYGFRNGYKAAYCLGQTNCDLPTFSVPVPLPGESSDDYEQGYNRGSLVGKKKRIASYYDDTSTATKDETIEWITSKLEDFCKGSYEDVFYSVKNHAIKHRKTVTFHVTHNYNDIYSGEINYVEEIPNDKLVTYIQQGSVEETLTKTTTFNLNDIAFVVIT